jgi:hypothetical protein
MADRADITPELLRQLLRYEPETGLFFWRHRPREYCDSDRSWRSWNTKWEGKQTFKVRSDNGRSGYTSIVGTINCTQFKAHRVAWAIHYGEWPDEIDHINGDPTDNRIENLRNVTHRENARNRRIPTNNTSGRMGVQWSKRHNKWLAFIRSEKRRGNAHLGLFDKFEDAVKAREAAEQANGYHANHNRRV